MNSVSSATRACPCHPCSRPRSDSGVSIHSYTARASLPGESGQVSLKTHPVRARRGSGAMPMTHARLRLPLLLACALLAAGCDRGGDAPAKRAQDVAKRDVHADGTPAGKPARAMPALPTVAPADVPAALEHADAAL